MPTPDEYRASVSFRRSSAMDAAGPSREASPEVDDAPPSIGTMVSSNGLQSWIPETWLKAISPNDDSILQRDGGEGLKLFDALLDDDQAFSALQQRRLAITSRDWEVAPGDDKDPRSVKAADDFRAMLKAIGFDRVTGLLHYAVWYGYGVGEALYSMRQHDGRTIVWLSDIVVPDRRHFGFSLEGELRLTSTMTGGIEGEALPPNKFITIRTGGTHDFAFYGLGLAHWCYWLIFFKRNALKFWALYLEKFGMPTVGIEFPVEEKDDKKALADRLAAAIAVGQDRAVLLPKGTLSDNGLKLIEAERSGAGASSYRDFVGVQDEGLQRVILGQPGTSKGMSTGLNSGQADVHKDVRDEIVKADADLISEAIHTIGRWMTTWNHGADVAPPSVYRVLDDAEDLNTIADRDVKLDGIGIRRSEESIKDVYGDGYEVDRLSEEQKAANAAALAASKVPSPGVTAPANDNRAMVAQRRAQFGIDDVAPLYVRRDLMPASARALSAWATAQGFKTTVPNTSMHATVLYSKRPVDWFDMGEAWGGEVTVIEGGPRKVQALGDDGAVVLRFNSPDMRWRHDSMVERGASHDFDDYRPHVTFTYDPGEVDLSKVEPFTGELRFGPEIFEPIKTGGFDPATLDFSAGEEEAIERLIAALVEDASPVFAAMAGELRTALQGVTTVEGARIALLGAMELMPVDRLARLTALPMLAERAGALAGAEDLVTA